MDDATFLEVLRLLGAIFTPGVKIGKSQAAPLPICMIDLSGTGLSVKSKTLLIETLSVLRVPRGKHIELDLHLQMVLQLTCQSFHWF